MRTMKSHNEFFDLTLLHFQVNFSFQFNDMVTVGVTVVVTVNRLYSSRGMFENLHIARTDVQDDLLKISTVMCSIIYCHVQPD